MTSNASTGNQTLSQQLGDIIIHDADEMGFDASTSGTITLASNETVKLTGAYNRSRNVCRFTHDGAKATLLKNITKVHLQVDE